MEKYISDERTGLKYEFVGDYYLIAGDDEPKPEPIGIWGQRHCNYLHEHKHAIYSGLLISGKLDSYLRDIDRQAEAMFSRVVKQMATQEGITEQLKVNDQMAWVGAMNNIRQRAAETVNAGIGVIDGKALVITCQSGGTGELTLTVEGTAASPTWLILADGAKLTATGVDENAGVKVASENALIITGQELGTGTVTATGGNHGAGIGGDQDNGGTVTINGGTVTATGKGGGAAIGGGSNGGSGTVTFGAGVTFAVKAGEAAPDTEMTSDAYANDHSAAYA